MGFVASASLLSVRKLNAPQKIPLPKTSLEEGFRRKTRSGKFRWWLIYIFYTLQGYVAVSAARSIIAQARMGTHTTKSHRSPFRFLQSHVDLRLCVQGTEEAKLRNLTYMRAHGGYL